MASYTPWYMPAVEFKQCSECWSLLPATDTWRHDQWHTVNQTLAVDLSTRVKELEQTLAKIYCDEKQPEVIADTPPCSSCKLYGGKHDDWCINGRIGRIECVKCGRFDGKHEFDCEDAVPF